MYVLIKNDVLGVKVEITNAANLIGFDLLHSDIDADRVIERRYFSSLTAAEAYAKSCTTDIIPPGTWMTL